MNRFFIVLLTALVCFGFMACNDNNNDSGKVSFSTIDGLDMTRLESNGYTVGSFTVDASTSWSVRADKTWITFSSTIDGEYFNDISGKEGKFTVYVKVSDAALDFAETKGNVIIVYGDTENLVASLVRPAMEYEFKIKTKVSTAEVVKGENGMENIVVSESVNIVDNIEFGHKNSISVFFETNFECAIIEFPEWLMEPVLMIDNYYSLEIVEEFLVKPQSGIIKVGNSNSTVMYEVSVEYAGMDPKTLKIERDYTPWKWNASLDGKTFKQESNSTDGDAESNVVTGNFCMNVVCHDYACRFLLLEADMEGNLTLIEGDDMWVKANLKDGSKNEYAVTIAPFNVTSKKMQRTGYLFAITDALYDEFLKNLSNNGTVESNDTYSSVIDIYESNVVLEVTQVDANGTVGCIITDSEGNMVNSLPEEEGDLFTYFDSDFSIDSDDISTCEFIPGKTYDINTKMTKPGGDKGVEFYDIAITYSEDASIEKIECTQIGLVASDEENAKYNAKIENALTWNMSISLQTDGFYHVTFTVPETQTNMFALRMYKWNYGPINLKVLIMRVKQ